VSLEDMAQALEGAVAGAETSELRHSYRHRAREFRRCAEGGWILKPNEEMLAFRQLYEQVPSSSKVLRLTPKTLTAAKAYQAEFEAWANSTKENAKYQAFHKFGLGYVDLAIPDCSYDQLVRLVNGSSSSRLPDGWYASEQGTSRYPVLRFRSAAMHRPFDFDTAEPYLKIVVQALVSRF
jgi:hypothetical protein